MSVADWGFILTLGGLVLFLLGWAFRNKRPIFGCIALLAIVILTVGCVMLAIFFIPPLIR